MQHGAFLPLSPPLSTPCQHATWKSTLSLSFTCLSLLACSWSSYLSLILSHSIYLSQLAQGDLQLKKILDEEEHDAALHQIPPPEDY